MNFNARKGSEFKAFFSASKFCSCRILATLRAFGGPGKFLDFRIEYVYGVP